MSAIPDAARHLAALRLLRPAQWRTTVRRALACGTIEGAATRLSVSRRTVERWIDADATLTDGIEMDARGPAKKAKASGD